MTKYTTDPIAENIIANHMIFWKRKSAGVISTLFNETMSVLNIMDAATADKICDMVFKIMKAPKEASILCLVTRCPRTIEAYIISTLEIMVNTAARII